MKNYIIGLLLIAGQATAQTKYSGMVGDIAFDPRTDIKGFHRCSFQTYQYFNDSDGFAYEGEKPAIEKVFSENFRPTTNGSGLVRVRFLVNCRGETNLFRLMGMDENYQEKTFDPSLTTQLLTLTKSLTGWKAKQIGGQAIDYYQYLIFKIKKGKIIEILP